MVRQESVWVVEYYLLRFSGVIMHPSDNFLSNGLRKRNCYLYRVLVNTFIRIIQKLSSVIKMKTESPVSEVS